MGTVYHKNKKTIQSKNVRKFTSRTDVFNYLSNDVFEKEHFIRHVLETAKVNKVSYLLAFDIITNHLTDILYEIDKNIISPKRKVQIGVYAYFYLRIGFMISNTKQKLEQLIIKKKQE